MQGQWTVLKSFWYVTKLHCFKPKIWSLCVDVKKLSKETQADITDDPGLCPKWLFWHEEKNIIGSGSIFISNTNISIIVGN